jgi:hypothetical protein
MSGGIGDAKKAVISWRKAIENSLISISPLKELGAKISPADMEEWFIDCRRDKPHEAIEFILKRGVGCQGTLL